LPPIYIYSHEVNLGPRNVNTDIQKWSQEIKDQHYAHIYTNELTIKTHCGTLIHTPCDCDPQESQVRGQKVAPAEM